MLLLYRVSLRAKGGDDLDWFIKIALCQSAIYLVAAWIDFHARSSRQTLVLVILFAAIFRLSILFAAPTLRMTSIVTSGTGTRASSKHQPVRAAGSLVQR